MGKTYVDILPIGTKGTKTLTYHTNTALAVGQLVTIPYGRRTVFGVTCSPAPTPKFTTKAVTSIVDLPPLPPHTLALAQWMSDYYAADIGACLQLLVPARPDIPGRPPKVAIAAESKRLQLTSTQTEVINTIRTQDKRAWLLHGVTGSGKTAVYIDLCRSTLEAGKSAIILVPEIALATQVIAEFKREFASVIITYSKMTASQRRAVWQQALTSTEPVVVIGPRSSLFLPVPDLGLIVIDECHESSYKQEQTPNYHARDVAATLARLTNAKLVLGSATPSAQDIFLADRDRLAIVELPEPIHTNRRTVEIVDMRGQTDILSPALLRGLRETLASGQQSLLFLNRRGSASQVLCGDCGHVSVCPDCDVPQTWHGDIGKLRCHWCGRQQKLPANCTECHSINRRFLGFGTKRVEADIAKRFPTARILRLDRDSFSLKTIETTMQRLQAGEIDILIGTQMIAKGLDLPQVSLVGVVLADTMLHIPDIYSGERTYQLLHQVIGRAGRRADQSAQVVIQTYSPQHPAIELAAAHKFHEFIQLELAERKSLGYPPYRYTLKLTAKRKTQAGARTSAQRLATRISNDYPDVTVRGPAPAWRESVGKDWYWHLILTSPKRSRLSEIVADIPAQWRSDLDPVDLL